MRTPIFMTQQLLLVAATAISLALALPVAADPADAPFVNFESPHVHPVDLSPDGTTLAVCNTPAGRLEVFDLRGDSPRRTALLPVGVDPVTVRFRGNDELWAANHISDSISIVDLKRQCVVRTLQTLDEPSDVVFAGNPVRAFVSCSQADAVLVFDPENLDQPPRKVAIQGQRPRALAASPDGESVYAAIFESGNGTTLLGGGSEEAFGRPFPPNTVNDPRGPYGDRRNANPPPNAGSSFDPPLNPRLPAPPKSALVVRKDEKGRWLDDNGKDWSRFISGDLASSSGRVEGWDLIDHDLARIDTKSLEVTYTSRLMNICMAVAVHPVSGKVAVVGTDARNEIRFEPVLNGAFLRVQLALVDPRPGSDALVADLNPHLDYRAARKPHPRRKESLGDPRGIAWSQDGRRAWITGMGSDNVVAISSDGLRTGKPIEVGEGPTGVALDEGRNRAYVLNRFGSSISILDLAAEKETARLAMHDPTPPMARRGRKHLYNTHQGSALGHIACASCHVDGRMDRLAWDLGNPAGSMKGLAGNNLGAGVAGLEVGFEDYHPMKGPMLTQTLQDIVGKEPFHWRGDRGSFEEFNETFIELQAADRMLSAEELQEFKAFLASFHFPPNPFRELDNSLPTRLPLEGHFATGRFGFAGRPLPPGNARAGLEIFRDTARRINRRAFACATCHTLPTGLGTDSTLTQHPSRNRQPAFAALPPGPRGERHHALVGLNFSVQHNTKVPQLRNLYRRTGFELGQTRSLAGFGFVHDGGIDSLARFVAHDVFDVRSDQEVAHLVAFLLCFSGSDFPQAAAWADATLLPPGTASRDAHAAMGRQFTLRSEASLDNDLLPLFMAVADRGAAQLAASSVQGHAPRQWRYRPGSDPNFVEHPSETATTLMEIKTFARTAAPVTFTLLPQFVDPAGAEPPPAPRHDQLDLSND